MSSKRKHTTLTIETKREIIGRLDRGEQRNTLAAQYGVGRATVYDIHRNRDRIEEFVAKGRAGANSRQTLKRGEFAVVEEALYAWYVCRRRDGPVSGTALAQRALSIHRQLHVGRGDSAPLFKASVGWLDKFKKRYGIRSFRENENDDDDYGEVQAAAEECGAGAPETFTAEEFAEKVKELRLAAHQVYLAEPSSLSWRSMPRGPRDATGTRPDRLTFVPCANASGTHKLDLLVQVGAGVTVSSEDVTDSESTRLPVSVYENADDDGVWQTTTGLTFCHWFVRHFVPSVRSFQRQRAVESLLAVAVTAADTEAHRDGFRALQSHASREGVRVAFVVPSGSLRIARAVRAEFRTLLLISLTVQSSGPVVDSAYSALHRMTAHDAVRLLARAWQAMTPARVVSSWFAAQTDADDRGADDQPGQSRALAARLFREHCSHHDDDDYRPTEDEIRQWLESSDDDDDATGRKPEEDPSVPSIPENRVAEARINDRRAVDSFDECIAWARENGIAMRELRVLRKLRDKAAAQQTLAIDRDTM